MELKLEMANSMIHGIGVLFGAAHMRAVTDLLIVKHKFRVTAAEWLEVFNYADA